MSTSNEKTNTKEVPSAKPPTPDGPVVDMELIRKKYDLALVQALLPDVVANDLEFLKRETRIHCFTQTDSRPTMALCVLGVFCMPFEHKATGSSAMLTNVSSVGQYATCIDMTGQLKTSWFTMTDHKIQPPVCFRVEWKGLLLYHFDETHGHLVINGIDTRSIPVEKQQK